MTQDDEVADVRELTKMYKSMPSKVDGRFNYARTDLQYLILQKRKSIQMKDKYR